MTFKSLSRRVTIYCLEIFSNPRHINCQPNFINPERLIRKKLISKKVHVNIVNL